MSRDTEEVGAAALVVVTGGAGFLGSHLCERLIRDGYEVLCVDDLSTGRRSNVDGLREHPRFRFLEQDLTGPALNTRLVASKPRFVVHLACPASPDAYLRVPVRTLRCGSVGTERALELAVSNGARFLLASTSEVYGDPTVHPQVESYWGNVNPIGPRSVYDESKRYAEALTMAYHRETGLSTGIARLFNTYGPRMRGDDGRLVPQLITEALTGQPLTIHGDGSQTRSLCYVDDLIDGLVALLHSDVVEPVNIGNPEEHTVLEIARIIAEITGTGTGLAFTNPRSDDPLRRKPDITRARTTLGWQPQVTVREGIARTVAWFQAVSDLARVGSPS